MTTPSTLTPPTRVPISAAAAVVTMARSLLLPEPKLPEPKLFRGDLMSGIADLLVIRPPDANRRTNARHRQDVPNRAAPRVLTTLRFRLAEFSHSCAATARRGSAGRRRQRRDRKR